MIIKLPQENDILPIAQKNSELIEFLANRRSTKIIDIDANFGPNEDELKNIISLAARVPDHGKIAPWKFLIVQGDARNKIGIDLANIFKSKNPNIDENHFNIEASRFLRAHSIVILVSSPIIHPKVPIWEQELSAGAIGYNFTIACNSFGYVATWLSEWPMFDEDAKKYFGLNENERFAGIFYIGGAKTPPFERERPNLEKIIKIMSKD